MTNKFLEYYSTQDKIDEMSEYVHLNFRLISTKMLSEMRRKLDINPSKTNEEGYQSLMYSLQGRMFNEMVYLMCGYCQAGGMKLEEIIPVTTLKLLLDLMQGKNPLEEEWNKRIVPLQKFNEFYLKEIDAIREHVEALPK